MSFSVAYLVALLVGAGWQAATLRGVVLAAIVWVIGRWLFRPLVDTVLDALAEAERKRREAQE